MLFALYSVVFYLGVTSKAQEIPSCDDLKGTELRECEGAKSASDYRRLGIAKDTFEVNQNLFRPEPEFFKNCRSKCKDPRNRDKCTFECKDDPCVGFQKKKNASCLQSGKRRKRMVMTEHWWRCDFPIPACCRTCRRTIPMIEFFDLPGGKKAYPVFCPQKGGFQLIDQIHCMEQKCKAKCALETTFYSFLVTETEPDVWRGHCDEQFLIVWFKTVEVDSYCVCPKEGKPKKIRKPKKKKGK